MPVYDKTGLVTVNESKGTAGGREKAAAFLTPTPVQWSFASLVDNILAQLETAACIAIDTVNRKVYFSDDPTKSAAMVLALQGDTLTIAPSEGQSGRSLVWESDGETGNSAVDNAVQALVAPAPQKKTVSGLVNSLLSMSDGTNPITPPKVIVIDQANKVVKLEDSASSITELGNLSLNAGNSGVLELSEPAVDTGETPLPFEGGEV